MYLKVEWDDVTKTIITSSSKKDTKFIIFCAVSFKVIIRTNDVD